MRGSAEHVGGAPLALALVGVLSCLWTLAWAGEGVPAQKKKLLHPHAVHLDIVEQSTPELAVEEIGSWAELLRSFAARVDVFAVEPEVRRLLARVRPEAVSADEKAIVVGELNRLMRQPNAGMRGAPPAPASAEAKQAALRYRKSKAPDDLRWLNRSLIADVFPQIARKARDPEIPPITCVTCHEGYAPAQPLPAEGRAVADADERAVTECFARAVAERRSVQECLARADALRAARIASLGPLTGTIQRRLPEGDVPLLAAIRPEAPYTFKPLLKRLVCTQCHGHGRTVDRVKGRHGEMKGIPLFYGEGFRQIPPEDLAGARAR